MNRRDNDKLDDSFLDETLDDTYAILNEVSSIENEIQSELRLQIPFFLNETETRTRHRQYQNVKFLNDTKRIEWEISRRIARVEREIRMNPPNKRPWFLSEQQQQQQQQRKSRLAKSRFHQRTTNTTNTTTSSRYKTDQLEDTTSFRLSERQPLVEDKNVGNVTTTFRETKAEKALYKTTQKKETTGLPKLRLSKDKENNPPSIVSPPSQEEKQEEIDSPQSSSIVSSSPLREKASPFKDEAVHSQQPSTKDQYNEKQLNLAQNDAPKPNHDKFKDFDVAFLDSDAAKAATNALEHTPRLTGIDEKQSHEQQQNHREEYEVPLVPAASIGRQLLSENRTMTTPVSYGQPPELTVGTGRMKKKMLNPEVLRRVFSDLDTDRDGGLTRLEVGLAMHRFHISIHPKAIASFFRNLGDQQQQQQQQQGQRHRKRMGTQTKETINYKQFVAFVTVAHQNQMKFQATKPKAPAFTNRQSSTRPHLPPLSIPSSPLASPTRSMTRTIVSKNIPQQYEVELKQYVIEEESSYSLESVQQQQQQATTFLETLLPDVILTQVLSSPSVVQELEEPEEPVAVIAQKEDERKEMVRTLAKELLLHHLKESPKAKRQETEPDWTGLSGLEAYLRQLQLKNPEEQEEEEEEELVRASIDSFSLEKETKDQVVGVVRDLLGKIKPKPVPPPLEEEEEKEEEELLVTTNFAQMDDKKSISMDVEIQTEPEAIVTTPVPQPEPSAVVTRPPPVALPVSVPGPESAKCSEEEEQPVVVVGNTWFGQLLYSQLPKKSLSMATSSNRSILKKLRVKRKIQQASIRHKAQEVSSKKIENATANSHEDNIVHQSVQGQVVVQRKDDGHEKKILVEEEEVEVEEEEFLPPDDHSNSGVLEKALRYHQPSLFASSLEDLTLRHSISSSESSYRSSNLSSSSSVSSSLVEGSVWQNRWGLLQHPKQRKQDEEGSEGELVDQDSDLSDGEVYGSTKQRILGYQETRARRQPQAQEISDDDEEKDSEHENDLVLETGQLHHMAQIQSLTRVEPMRISVSSSIESGEIELGAVL